MVSPGEIAFYIIFTSGIIFSLLGIIFPPDNLIKKTNNRGIKCILSVDCDDKTGDFFWISTHFLLYFLFGLIIPNRWDLIILSIFIWELYEFILHKMVPWYNESRFKKIGDVIADISGYCLGMFTLYSLSK